MTGQYRASREGETGEAQDGVSKRAAGDREVLRRSYIDRDGLTWEVRQVAGADVPGARGGVCLVFESPVVIRRVWDVPPNWRGMSADELSELSWHK